MWEGEKGVVEVGLKTDVRSGLQGYWVQICSFNILQGSAVMGSVGLVMWLETGLGLHHDIYKSLRVDFQ